MNKLTSLFAGIITLNMFFACSDDDLNIQDSSFKTPIFGEVEDALPGRLLVKFRTEPNNEMLINGQDESKLSLTGINSVDSVLSKINAKEIRRVFPVNKKREEITRKSTLHLWYVIEFDEQKSVAEVANLFATLTEVEKIEYSRVNKAIVDPVKSTSSFLSTYRSLNQSSSAFVNDPMYNLQWNLNNDGSFFDYNCIAGADVNIEKAWERCAGDPSIIVAVVDQGVMYDHPDLFDNMWVNEEEEYGSKIDNDGNGYKGDRYGFNFIDYNGKFTYGTGHGTHVAGTVAAVNNNGIGVSSIAGGTGNNDGVKIMGCQITDGKSYVTIEREVEAIKYAADNGAVILQCSWGIPSGISNDEQWESLFPLEKEVIDYFIHNAGSPSGVIDGGIVVFAAGNEGNPKVGYPANYEECVAVTSIAPDFTPSLFTNYGNGADLTAPGGDYVYLGKNDQAMILSTMPPIDASNYELYGYKQGTSMACPHVSAVAALGLSYAAKLKKHFKADEFKKLLLASSTSIESYLAGNKIYYLEQNTVIDGRDTVIMIERTKSMTVYKNRMGGLVDANKMLDAIEGNGTQMKIPNYTVGLNNKVTDNLSKYLVEGTFGQFTVSDYDTSVAEITFDGSVINIKPVNTGVTTAKITSGSFSQEITVIVRKSAGNGNGWL